MAHEELATRSLPGVPFIRDRQPLPDLTLATAILVYADSCDHMGPDRVVLDKNRVKMSAHVNSLGLFTHDIVEASTEGASLGVHYDGVIGLVTGSPEKDMALDQALTTILKGAKLIGSDMKKVLGHATVRCMLRSPLFSISDSLTLLATWLATLVCLCGHRLATRSGFLELCLF